MTLSVFARPCHNSRHSVSHVYGETLSKTTPFFNSVALNPGKKIADLETEAKKAAKKAGIKIETKDGAAAAPEAEKPKSPKKSPAKKKKGAEEEEKPKPKEKTRDDEFIIGKLDEPFHGGNFEYRMEQLIEVADMKQQLAKDRVNVSADVLTRAVVLPEENDRSYTLPQRHYPKIQEMLFHNIFAVKKKKKGKKGKKRKK